MADPVTDDMRDPKTPASVQIRAEARAPITDPTLGRAVPAAAGSARHRLVTLGDSVTQGFQSGAIYATDLSFPRIIAREMGWSDQFRYPRYAGPGGLPVNIEYVVRRLESEFGDKINWWEAASAAFSLRSVMDEIEDYWERGPGSQVPKVSGIHHNLAVYGWDLRDAMSRTTARCLEAIASPKDDWLAQIVEDHNDRAALRVLPPITTANPAGSSMLSAAEALGNDGGIETLIVFLGANNALSAVVDLKVVWSREGSGGTRDYQDLEKKKAFTVWDPAHFVVELDELVTRVKKIKAQRVIWATVPHITVVPIARGVASKVAPGSRYFPYYTRPWIRDDQFAVEDDPNITANEARAIDSAIDQYNDAIVDRIGKARDNNLDWLIIDVAGILDRLAYRRYIDDVEARPAWWSEYPLPEPLRRLSPGLDSRFFHSGAGGRTQGGLFSLDGVHPTTVTYGILAQEFIDVMQRAQVPFFRGDGKTPRLDRVTVDFERLIAVDTLISDPPASLSSDLNLIGWLDQTVDLFRRLF